ncbi:hypothetical protein F2Q69_00050898 [Brassica cretica]|uniref:Uncharacterized protein n=1 Tax=Brassica cretica TaxID=69181 RepID=A0A8S9PL38_BRACR|nr:hypothetical protein F2Q69_00050898 [Brassica cretica]
MSAINITNVSVLDNPAPFVSPFQFEISYECLTSLQDVTDSFNHLLVSKYNIKKNDSVYLVPFFCVGTDLEWKLVYVGSAEDETYDQTLESVLVGPVNVGNYRFVLQVN